MTLTREEIIGALKDFIEGMDLNETVTVTVPVLFLKDVGRLLTIDEMPTVGGWISVKDRLPEEHNSIFANFTHLSKHMWAKESDNVIVYVRFPDGTGRATEGRLQDGKWWTRISSALDPVVTHWQPFPESPAELGGKEHV